MRPVLVQTSLDQPQEESRNLIHFQLNTMPGTQQGTQADLGFQDDGIITSQEDL